MNRTIPNTAKVYVLKAENNLFQFYCSRPVDLVPIEQFESFKPSGDAVFYVSQQTLDELRQRHDAFIIRQSFVDYPKENVIPHFINRSTREETLGQVYLLSKP